VSYHLNNTQPVKIEVFNATGLRVASVDATAGVGSTALDLSELSQGIYLVRISNNGLTATRKVMVKQ
jgi:hypothetical protein